MKLTNLSDNFDQTNLIDNKALQDDFAVLRTYISDVFPSQDRKDMSREEIESEKKVLNQIISKLGYQEKFDTLDKKGLVFHLYDTEWLIQYFRKIIKQDFADNKSKQKILREIDQKALNYFPDYKQDFKTNNKKLFLTRRASDRKIKPSSIQKFIETDREFAQARESFADEIMRAQIEHMKSGEEPNGLLYRKQYDPVLNQPVLVLIYDPMTSREQPDTDKAFFNGLIHALKQLDFNRATIGHGLARFADSWLPQTMEDAYYNKYPLIPNRKETAKDVTNWYSINMERENCKEVWLMQRKAEYYKTLYKLGLTKSQTNISEEGKKELDEKIKLWDLYYQTFNQQKITCRNKIYGRNL